MTTATLYKHRIYCLHGVAGQITENVASGDKTFTVNGQTLSDVTIAVGSQIWLKDAVDTSPTMTILSIDTNASTITVDVAPGIAFSASSPTNVVRVPHWVYKWTESDSQLTQCPVDASHPVQPGSASTVDVKLPNEVIVQQSKSNYRSPHIYSKLLTVASGESGSVTFSWQYPGTVQNVEGRFIQSNNGDNFDFEANPDYTVGLLTQNVNSGTTVLPVSQTVLSYVRMAYVIKLVEGATTENVGRVTYIDKVAETITVTTGTTSSFTTAANVVATIKNAESVLVPPTTSGPSKIEVGKHHLAGYNIAPGVPLKITYHNVGPGISTTYIYVRLLTE